VIAYAVVTFLTASSAVIPSGSATTPERRASWAAASVGVVVIAPASSPAEVPVGYESMPANHAARRKPVAATTTESRKYRGPSRRSMVKKLGPAWKPTEKMNSTKPNVWTFGESSWPRCPKTSPAKSTPVTGPSSNPRSLAFPIR
jgi:hypothetical protein